MLAKINSQSGQGYLSCAVFLFWAVVSQAALAGEGSAVISADDVMPAEHEPLHVVRYHCDQFMIYTNWVESGVTTQYHKHAHDLLAMIPVQTTVTGQKPGEEPGRQVISPGTVGFFPYADNPQPYVHRVGAIEGTTFVNVGLDFRLPVSQACDGGEPLWAGPEIELLQLNRRGQPYLVTLQSGGSVGLPADGRALLLVPIGDAELSTDAEPWSSKVGDFRFFEGSRPALLNNRGAGAVTVMVFKAC